MDQGIQEAIRQLYDRLASTPMDPGLHGAIGILLTRGGGFDGWAQLHFAAAGAIAMLNESTDPGSRARMRLADQAVMSTGQLMGGSRRLN